jgi:hypothetical protein
MPYIAHYFTRDVFREFSLFMPILSCCRLMFYSEMILLDASA